MVKRNPYCWLPAKTELELDDRNRNILCSDHANTIISAKELGYEVAWSEIHKRFPNCSKKIFLSRREQLRYGRKLSGYELHTFPVNNVDVPLALYLNHLKDNLCYDTLVLAANDGGYYYALTELKQMGLEIKFLGFEHSFNPVLLELGEFIPMGQDFLQPLLRR